MPCEVVLQSVGSYIYTRQGFLPSLQYAARSVWGTLKSSCAECQIFLYCHFVVVKKKKKRVFKTSQPERFLPELRFAHEASDLLS